MSSDDEIHVLVFALQALPAELPSKPLMEVSVYLAFYGFNNALKLCPYYSVDQELLIAENYFIVAITFMSPFLS